MFKNIITLLFFLQFVIANIYEMSAYHHSQITSSERTPVDLGVVNNDDENEITIVGLTWALKHDDVIIEESKEIQVGPFTIKPGTTFGFKQDIVISGLTGSYDLQLKLSLSNNKFLSSTSPIQLLENSPWEDFEEYREGSELVRWGMFTVGVLGLIVTGIVFNNGVLKPNKFRAEVAKKRREEDIKRYEESWAKSNMKPVSPTAATQEKGLRSRKI